MSFFKRLNPLAAVADQAWLSMLNFAISLAFIWGASKSEYAYYLLLFAPLLLVQSIQNAVVNSPLTTFLPAAAEHDKAALRQTAVSLHIYLAFVAAVVGGLGLFVYESWAGLQIDPALIVGFAFAIIGSVAREAQRSLAYVEGKGLQALGGDLLYGVVLLLGIALALYQQTLSATIVLGLTGLAGLLPLVRKLSAFEGVMLHSMPMRQFWSCGKWAIPAVAATWLSLSAYPYFAERNLGLAAVAEIGAARLFVMPVGLFTTAWSNWYRPKVTAWMAIGDVANTKRLTFASVLIGIATLVAFAGTLLALYPELEHWLKPQYHGMLPLVLGWICFFAFSFVRTVFMATLMTNADGYKAFYFITWLSLAISVPGLMYFSSWGAVWVVIVLCVVELVQALLVIYKSMQSWRVRKAVITKQKFENLQKPDVYTSAEEKGKESPQLGIDGAIEKLSVTVAVCTYQRPTQLKNGLDALWRQSGKLPSKGIQVVIVDNDSAGSARAIIEQSSPPEGWSLSYFVEPRPGVSFARNRCLKESSSDLIAFFDDDEEPSPNWLTCLLETYCRTNANAVFGPVLSVFDQVPPSWIKECAAYKRPRFSTGQKINWENSRTGNVLFERRMADYVGGGFDERFASSGGEDVLFFAMAERFGASLVWSDGAIVEERVPRERMRVNYLIRRSFKGGQTWGRVKVELGQMKFWHIALQGCSVTVVGCLSLVPALLLSRNLVVRNFQCIAGGLGKMSAWWAARHEGGSRAKHYIG